MEVVGVVLLLRLALCAHASINDAAHIMYHGKLSKDAGLG